MPSRRRMRRILLSFLGVSMLAFKFTGGTARAASVNIAAGAPTGVAVELVN